MKRKRAKGKQVVVGGATVCRLGCGSRGNAWARACIDWGATAGTHGCDGEEPVDEEAADHTVPTTKVGRGRRCCK